MSNFVPVDYTREAIVQYCTKEEANTYHGLTLRGKEWSETSDGDKDLALYQATLSINGLRYAGYKTVATQGNQFPRNGSSQIPDDIKEACMEIALCLIQGVHPDLEVIQAGFEVSTVVSARVAKNPDRTPVWILSGIPSLSAWQKLIPYLDDGLGVSLARV